MSLLKGVAEALRRLFGSPRVHALAAPRPSAAAHRGGLLFCDPRAGLDPLHGEAAEAALFREGAAMGELAPFAAELRTEDAWARWAGEAQILAPDLFPAGQAAGGRVPPLPAAESRRLAVPTLPLPATRALPAGMKPSRAVGLPIPTFEASSRMGLGHVLRRPFAFRSEAVQALPKALWMRYSLALVKATGENVRNLEVLGLWRLPRSGVTGLRPEEGGRLWVQLSPEASGAPRAAFMVARKKDDHSLVSAFVE